MINIRIIGLVLIISILNINIALAASSISVSTSVIDFGNVDWGDESSTKTLTITNDGTTNLTNVLVSDTASSSYNVVINDTTAFNLTTNEVRSISIQMTLQDKKNQVQGNSSFGNITITSDQITASNTSLYVTSPLRLAINNIDVKVDGRLDTDLEDGEKIDETAQPGDLIEFIVKLENLFDSDDYDIEEIEIEISIEEIKDGDNIDAKTVEFDISAGDIKEQTISLTIPESVESQTYDVIIYIEGENTDDDNNIKYNFSQKLKLRVQKPKHDVQISSLSLNPSILNCGDLETMFDIQLVNKGRTSEKEVVLEVKNSNLNINQIYPGINIKKDSGKGTRYNQMVQIVLDPEFAVPGTYPITVNSYADDGSGYSNTTDLIIKKCDEPVAEPVVEEPVAEPVPEVIKEEEPVVEKINTEPKINLAVPPPSISIKENKGLNLVFPIVGLVVLITAIGITSLIVHLKNQEK